MNKFKKVSRIPTCIPDTFYLWYNTYTGGWKTVSLILIEGRGVEMKHCLKCTHCRWDDDREAMISENFYDGCCELLDEGVELFCKSDCTYYKRDERRSYRYPVDRALRYRILIQRS